jgi:cytoskeleton-binding toxin CbtA-like protein
MTHEQQVWQSTVSVLLHRHFGLTLNDTQFCEETCVAELQKAGIRPFEVINDLVDKYQLIRLRNNHPYQLHSPYLNAADELIFALEAGATLRMISYP